MGNKSKCLRCGFVYKGIISVDPENIEKEEETKISRRVVNPDEIHVSRARSGGSIFDDFVGGIFGDSVFGGLGDVFGNLFGEFFGYDRGEEGYTYDPKYYDSFGNEIYVPDEFERESVEIYDVELLEEQPKSHHNPRSSVKARPEENHGAKHKKHGGRQRHNH